VPTRLAARLFVPAVLAGALAALAPAGAGAATDPAGWNLLARDIASPWPRLQNGNGSFRDYVYGGQVSFCTTQRCPQGPGNARYGESVLGYALLQTGLRNSDPALIDAGLRGVAFAVRHPELQRKIPTVFETLAVAGAYNLARESAADHPVFTANRARWERWLARVKPQHLISRRAYYNHHLAEVIAVFELLRTGVESKNRRTILSERQRDRLKRLAVKLVNRDIPRIAAETSRTARRRSGDGAQTAQVLGERATILSDRPDFPIAYQAFSYGLYARAVRLLPVRETERVRELMRRMAHASWLLTAPDGDLAYWGRSQEQVWAPTSTAYGAEVTARLRGSDAVHDARYRALADRAVARLRAAHANGDRGMALIPALSIDPQEGLRGLDRYAGAAAFDGLALLMLNWALDEAGDRPRATSSLALDRPRSARLLRGDTSFAVVRTGSLWFAVKQATSYEGHPADLRYDFGLVALKDESGGVWRDLIPLRPITARGPDSAGPVLRTAQGPAFPAGTSMFTGADGTVTVVGDFRTATGTRLKQGTTFRFEPAGCGVRFTFPAGGGESLEYSVFLRGDPGGVDVLETSVADAGQRVDFSEPAQVVLEPGYSSGSDPKLTRARISFAAAGERQLAVTVCRR
jgi:hypothetical protein